jgi:hypothetical protein
VGLAIRREALDPRQRVLDRRLLGADGIRQPEWNTAVPSAEAPGREEARKLDEIAIPGMPEGAERSGTRVIRKAVPVQLLRIVHFDRRRRYRPSSLVANSIGFQRVRAAAYIQIREPELQHSNPSGGFAASMRLPWQGVRLKREVRPAALPVRLRPVVHTPEWAA